MPFKTPDMPNDALALPSAGALTPAVAIPSGPIATMGLAYDGSGLYLITSRKRRADGGYDEARYPVYAQSLRCGCPAGLRGTGRSGLCKHSRFLNDYLCGRVAEYVEYDR